MCSAHNVPHMALLPLLLLVLALSQSPSYCAAALGSSPRTANPLAVQRQHGRGLGAASASQAKLPPKASAILDCFAGDDCLSSPTVWNTFLEDRPACLKPHRIWWSSRPSPFAVTLVTQLSADRLPQVRAQCATWSGPLAAVLYLPLVNVTGGVLSQAQERRLQNAEAAVEDFFNQAEDPQNKKLLCQLRLMLVYETVDDDQVATLYPVNSLRNYARLMADTELIANIDVDMLPSVSVSEALNNATRFKLYLEAARKNQV